MTRLHDPLFINFDGSPVTGRTPPLVRVAEGKQLTPEQHGMVSHAYKLFRDAVRVQTGDYLVQNRVLADGTRVRMESMQDKDVVYVWPVGGEREEKLPHGFAVVSNWSRPKIYKRRLSWTLGQQWEFGNDNVPQPAPSGETFDNQAFRKPSGRPWLNLPHVLQKAKKTLWDYARRKGLVSGAGNITPFWIKNSVTESFGISLAHYASENKILNSAGTTLYTMTDSAGILAPSAENYPELLRYLPPTTDAEGNQLALQQWRYAVTSPTANIWQFRFCNERIERTGDATYAAAERNTTDLVVPYGKQTTTISGGTYYTLGEDVSGQVWFRAQYGAGVSGSGWFPDPGVNINWRTGLTDYAVDTSGREVITDGGFRQILEAGSGGYTDIPKLIAIGSAQEITYAKLCFGLNFPASVYWRAGQIISHMNTTAFGYPSAYYGVIDYQRKRIDTKHDVDGEPKIKLGLGWKDYMLLDGTTTGRCSGHKYVTLTTSAHHVGDYEGGLAGLDFVTVLTTGLAIGSRAYYDWLVANNRKADRVDGIITGYPNGITTVTDDVRPVNTGSYTYTSRHIIDFDNKGRFIAAIRCEVACSGASWKEDRGFYDGWMIQDAAPTYTVKIYFEVTWDTVVNSLLLVEESVTRPAFEFITLSKINPYYYNLPAYSDRFMPVRVPPELSPSEDFYMQFATVASHQGVNTNLCCADVRPDITGDDVALTQSQKGVEYSYRRGKQVVPHTRYVTGQLYARTFKLSDISESLWMLKQLKVDAVEDNFQPIDGPTRPPWFYHPVIKAALDVQRHIEVRDGVIVQWSDNLYGDAVGHPPVPTAAPAPTSREIKLYRV